MTIETIAIIGATATVVAGFGGAAFGSYFAYLSGVKLMQKTHAHDVNLARNQEFNKAASIFRAAFISEIFLLQENIKTGGKMPDEIINQDILIAHEKAKILFEPFLPSAELEGFNTAWKNYKNSKDNHIQQTQTKDMNLKSYKTELCRVYLTHMNSLLEYAKPKI